MTSSKPPSVAALQCLLPRDEHLAAVLDAEHPEVELSTLQLARQRRASSSAMCSLRCAAGACSSKQKSALRTQDHAGLSCMWWAVGKWGYGAFAHTRTCRASCTRMAGHVVAGVPSLRALAWLVECEELTRGVCPRHGLASEVPVLADVALQAPGSTEVSVPVRLEARASAGDCRKGVHDRLTRERKSPARSEIAVRSCHEAC